jgi:hypothetical protein
MAGVKGKSGGPRKNSGGARPNSGGTRTGAGRKPKEVPAPVPIAPEVAKAVEGEPLDPRPTLELIALGMLEVPPQQYKALTALLPYVHPKKGEGGKKEEKKDAAKTAAKGKFAAAAAPPKLVVNNKR